MQVHGTWHAMPWSGCASLHTHGMADIPPQQEREGEAHTKLSLSRDCPSVAPADCAAAQSFGEACVEPGACQCWLEYHEANKTITEMKLHKNEIGDGGAIALGESLRAMLVTCVFQMRASLFLWPVRTQFHRRRCATCRATVFTCCSASLVRDDECRLRGVSRRQVRQEVTRSRPA